MEEKIIGKKRKPTNDEMRLIEYLVNKANYRLDANFRKDLYVAPITYSTSSTRKKEDSILTRIFNTLFQKHPIISSLKIFYDVPLELSEKVITECQFADQDDVTVSAVLRVNRDNQLDELAIWKTDNSPISRIPPCEQMKYILVGAPFMTATMTLNNQIRFQGNAMYAMIGIIVGAILNVALVPIFAFSLSMGVKGAAIGTVIGQIVSFVILVLMTFKGGNIRLSLKNVSFSRKYHFEMFKGGTPSLSRQGLASVSTLLLNLAAGVYGDAAIAGMSIVTRITFVIFSIIIGIGQGFQPMCGFNYGAKLYDRVRKGYFFSIEIGSAFLLACGALGFIYADKIVDVLRHDPEVVSVGAAALRWQIITFIFACVITISNMALQTSGRSIAANLLAACRNGIFFMPLILILPKYFGLLGVEMCQAVADVLSFIVAVPLITHYFRSISS